MKRKINRVGPNTLTVSLPSKWAKRYGLRKGDEINLEEQTNGTEYRLSAVPFGGYVKMAGETYDDRPSGAECA